MLKTTWGIGLVALGLLFGVLAIPAEDKWFIPYGVAGIIICCLGMFLAELREYKKRASVKPRLIEIQYGESIGKLVTVTVTNKAEREKRVLSLALRLFGQDGKVRDEILDAGDGRTLKVKEFKRAKGLPHVMPPLSSFEAEYYISLGTFIAHNLSGYQASIKMEDHTIIDGEKRIFPKASP
jgi:hypothetical protein